MSEQFFIEQLDEIVDAIVTRGTVPVRPEPNTELGELLPIAEDLYLLPRQNFKLELKESLSRRINMSTATTEKSKDYTSIGYQTITPYLTVKRAAELLEFIKQALGGIEVMRTTGSAGGLHAEVVFGDSKVMIGGYEAVEEKPTALHLYVPDADAVYRRALELGATSVEEPVDQSYGDREAGVKDPTGNVWWIATHKIGSSHIPEGMKPVTPFLHPIGAPALIDFMKEAFLAEEVSREQSPAGVIHHAVVRIGGSMIEMGEAHGDAQPMPPALFMYVENVEESYERALKAGATSLQEPSTQAYGRTAWVQDAWGNVWYLTAPIVQS
jgi:uncharacterized glyoxalase superfamily protein PhnB